jgi:hypothetical protein
VTRRSRPEPLSFEGRRPAREYKEAQLRQFLVSDAVKHHATDLPWAIAAYTRIGKLSGKGAEAAYQQVLDEVEALTGLRVMPVTSLSEVELARLLK